MHTSDLDAAWLDQVSIPALGRKVGAATLSRGQGYLQRVLRCDIGRDGMLLTGVVAGSGHNRYQVRVDGNDVLNDDTFLGNCTCPVGLSCKHTVALVLHAAARRQRPGGGDAPGWRSQLTRLLGAAHATYQDVALVVERTSSYAMQAALGLRPLLQGKKGWIKTGIGWRQIQDRNLAGTVEPETLRRLEAICALRYGQFWTGNHLLLDQLPPDVWPLLLQWQEVGLPLLTAQHNPHPVRILPGLRAGLARKELPDGALQLEVALADRQLPADRLPTGWSGSQLLPIGSPVHGFALPLGARGMALLPLTPYPGDGLARLLTPGGSKITIPAGERDDFDQEFGGRLEEHELLLVREETLPLRQVEEVALVLVVETTGPHELVVNWAVRYLAADAHLLAEYHYRQLMVHWSETDDDAEAYQHFGERDPERERRLRSRAAAQLLARGGDVLALALGGQLTGEDCREFCTEVLPELQQLTAFTVEVRGALPRYRLATDPVEITSAVVGEGIDWFNLRVTVRVGDEEVPVAALMAAVAAEDDYLLLDSGTLVPLATPEVQTLARLMAQGRDLQDPAAPDILHLGLVHAGFYQELAAEGLVQGAATRWQERLAALLPEIPNGTRSEAGQGPTSFATTLRPYQRHGYDWLIQRTRYGLGAILADDMGLGKTVQVLAAICHLREKHPDGPPVLVVAPSSVIGTWVEQAQKFCPHLRVRAIVRTAAKRQRTLGEDCAEADIVVTSYAIARLDRTEFADRQWQWLVCDEAQFVKNHQSTTHKVLCGLAAESTLVVTGTPLENSLMDLWALAKLATPGLLPPLPRFRSQFLRPIAQGDRQALAGLQRRLGPFLLRRTKEDVAPELPVKTEHVLHVELDVAHRQAYDRRLARERQRVLRLLEDDSPQGRFSALQSLTILRQMALDPALCDGAGAARRLGGRSKPSAKIAVLIEQLLQVRAEGHRCLVFSQFTRYLAQVRTHLEAVGISTLYLDGATTNRQAVLSKFRSGNADAFLISLKAGGFGLNLTEADYVYLLDPWWNPQAEAQAVDRVHRIGQERPVLVYRLVASETIEERVMELKARKAELFARVVQGMDSDKAELGLSAADIRELLSSTTLAGETSRPGGRGTEVTRNVRAPQGRVMANGHPG